MPPEAGRRVVVRRRRRRRAAAGRVVSGRVRRGAAGGRAAARRAARAARGVARGRPDDGAGAEPGQGGAVRRGRGPGGRGRRFCRGGAGGRLRGRFAGRRGRLAGRRGRHGAADRPLARAARRGGGGVAGRRKTEGSGVPRRDDAVASRAERRPGAGAPARRRRAPDAALGDLLGGRRRGRGRRGERPEAGPDGDAAHRAAPAEDLRLVRPLRRRLASRGATRDADAHASGQRVRGHGLGLALGVK